MSDDPFVDLIDVTVGELMKVGIDYAVTGSVVSGIHGEPVTSYDVDIIVQMNESQAARLAHALPQRFYRSEDSLVEAARTFGMANLIDADTGLKVDLSCMRPTKYREAIFSRRVKASLGPGTPEFDAVSPEDIVLMKLLWRKETRSQKQWENALSVVRVKGVSLEWKYLFEQARNLDIEDDLTRLRDEAGI